MTATEQIKVMMADAYDRYAKALKAQTEPNKYRANFYKGRFEAFRESLNTLENDHRTNTKAERDAKESAD